MRTSNKIVALTVGMVVLAGVLSGGLALWHTLRVSSAYDEAMKAELQQKGLAYAQSAAAILSTPGDSNGLATFADFLLSSRSASHRSPASRPAATLRTSRTRRSAFRLGSLTPQRPAACGWSIAKRWQGFPANRTTILSFMPWCRMLGGPDSHRLRLTSTTRTLISRFPSPSPLGRR